MQITQINVFGNDDIFEDDSIKTKKKWPNLLNERSHMILEKFDGI